MSDHSFAYCVIGLMIALILFLGGLGTVSGVDEYRRRTDNQGSYR